MPEAHESFNRIVEQCVLMEIQEVSLCATLSQPRGGRGDSSGTPGCRLYP